MALKICIFLEFETVSQTTEQLCSKIIGWHSYSIVIHEQQHDVIHLGTEVSFHLYTLSIRRVLYIVKMQEMCENGKGSPQYVCYNEFELNPVGHLLQTFHRETLLEDKPQGV